MKAVGRIEPEAQSAVTVSYCVSSVNPILRVT